MSERDGILAYLRSRAGRAYRAVRNAVDWLLHPARHRRIRTRLAGARPRSILVICYGNVCRSPYLAAVLRHALPDVQVVSAGFIGAGRGVPEHSLTIAERRGLDLVGHRSQLITRELAAAADLIVVMDSRQAQRVRAFFGVHPARIIVAGDLDRQIGTMRAIEDPWRKPLEAFEAAFARLDRCAEGLVTLVTPADPRSHAGDKLVDQ